MYTNSPIHYLLATFRSSLPPLRKSTRLFGKEGLTALISIISPFSDNWAPNLWGPLFLNLYCTNLILTVFELEKNLLPTACFNWDRDGLVSWTFPAVRKHWNISLWELWNDILQWDVFNSRSELHLVGFRITKLDRVTHLRCSLPRVAIFSIRITFQILKKKKLYNIWSKHFLHVIRFLSVNQRLNITNWK